MIHDGVLAALATPADFKAHFLHGELLGVECSDPLSAVDLLQGLPGVSEVTVYGSSIHVLGQHGIDPTVRAALTNAGVRVDGIHPIPPTLEDVFISLMGHKAE